MAGEFQPALGQGGDEDLWSIITLLTSWFHATELTGATCGDPVPVAEAMEPVWDRYIDDYAARLDRDGMDLGQWRRTWAIDLTEAITLKANVQYFGLSGIETAIVMNGGGVVAAYAWPGAPPPAPRPPPAEWRKFTLDAVKRDVQLCGTRIDVTVFDDVPEELVDQAAYLGRGRDQW